MRARALSIQMSPSNTGARAGIIELLERALILDPSSVVESRANPSLKHVHIGVRWSRRQPGGEGAIKKIGVNPMHYPLIKCPSGARQAAPQLKDLDTPRRLVIKYKINLLYWN